MCNWCARSRIAEALTAGITPGRRRFMAAAAGAALAAQAPAAAQTAPAQTAPAQTAPAPRAEAIFRNGRIHPMTGAPPLEALAIGGGRILAAGTAAEAAALAGPGTRMVDLGGRALFPGFIDPHNHTVLSSLFDALLVNIGFFRCRTKADALAAMRATAARAAPGAWMAFGFYDNLLQGGDLSMAELDAISTTSPIFVLYVNGHVGAGNSLAFQRAGVTRETGPLPGGGFFGRGADGALNGLIYNEPALLRFAGQAVPRPDAAAMTRAIEAYAHKAAAAGLTALHEPGTVKPEWIGMLAQLSNRLPIRLSASFSTDMIEASKPFAALGPAHRARHVPDSRLSLYGMKYWGDGSNQAETAAQTRPYLNSTARGTLGYSQAQAVALCTAAKEAGWSILIHSQGDAAIDQALDAIETAYGANPPTGVNRIEHATMARPDQIARMKRLGIEASFMTDFIHLYGADYRDKLFGAERAAFMCPVGAAARAGVGHSLHTDNPAAGMPLNPLRLVQTAVTRRCMVDGSVLGPDITLSVDEALRGITINAARQMGLGEMLGTLAPGKAADLTILQGDPYATDPAKLAEIQVSETWVAGEKAFG